jgi:NADP-dependent 3-hydroxy acid dehydrogenase YdfG
MAPSVSATLLSARASVTALRRRTTTHARAAPLRRAAATSAAAEAAEGKGGVVLITGANTGLGKRAALQLSKAGYTVVGACRSLARGEAAAADIAAAGGAMDVMELDLNSFASVTAFAAAFKAKHSRCDVLCNNAGIMVRPP